MANDKDFIVKNAVEVGGSTKTTLGTVTNDNIDLSTGNYFAHSPSGATTYTISNAATNQSFQLEVTGGTEEVAQNFSTTLYTGNGSTQTITNGIDLATDGGLVWTKDRDTGVYHALTDTERGGQYALYSPATDAQVDRGSDFITSFNSDGYSIGADGLLNDTYNYVSWTFKKAAGFFDVVTWTGDGTSSRYINHNLNSEIGMILVKTTDLSENWFVAHRTAGSGYSTGFSINLTNAAVLQGNVATSNFTTTQFNTDFVREPANGTCNDNGRNYVAYLFAHDTASDGLIQCGSFTTNPSGDASVTLGWQPQWILYKRTDGISNWGMHDTQRVWSETYWNPLYADVNNAESGFAATRGWPTSTGFEFQGQLSASANYIYVAIRSAADLDLTWPTSIEWAGGVSPAAPATGETDLFSISTDDGGTTYQGFKVADNLS